MVELVQVKSLWCRFARAGHDPRGCERSGCPCPCHLPLDEQLRRSLKR